MSHPFYTNPTKVATSCGSTVHFWSRGLNTVARDQPVLVLVHGYPQSSFMFRHLIPLLPPELALFIPDLPGYGDSTPSEKGHDKRTISTALLEALSASLPPSPSASPTPPQQIVLCGHDRGARVLHRLAVDCSKTPTHPSLHPAFSISSLILLDIVPTLTQWSSFASAPGITSSFHWPFLANVPLATELIIARGGGWFCRELIRRWAGSNERRVSMLEEGGAMDVYAGFFEKESVVRASCEDYRAGATVDVEVQRADQEVGRKIGCPALVLYSDSYLGKRYDVGGVWREWVGDGVEVTAEGIGDGCGHFLVEEAPGEVAGFLRGWLGAMGLNWSEKD